MKLKVPDAVPEKRVEELLANTREQRADRYFAIHNAWLRSVIDGGRWVLGPIVLTRDSENIEKVNHEALVKKLKEHKIPESTYVFLDFNHFAVGWVTRLCYQVLTTAGKVTKVCRFMEAWNEALEDYPCADDDRLSELDLEDVHDYLDAEYDSWTSKERRPADYIEEICECFSVSSMEDLRRYGFMDRPSTKAKGVVQDQIEKYVFEMGWMECDQCSGCGMVPFDSRLDDPQDEALPGFVPCDSCDAFDYWDFDLQGNPVLPSVQTCEEPTPLFDWLLYPEPGALLPVPPWLCAV